MAKMEIPQPTYSSQVNGLDYHSAATKPDQKYDDQRFSAIYPSEPTAAIKTREFAFDAAWTKVSATIKIMLEKLNKTCLHDILQYLFDERVLEIRRPGHAFRTAIVAVGNMDGGLLMKTIQEHLFHQVSFVPMLASTDCKGSARHLLYSIIAQFNVFSEMQAASAEWVTKELNKLHAAGRFRSSRHAYVSHSDSSFRFQVANELKDTKFNRVRLQTLFHEFETKVKDLLNESDDLHLKLKIFERQHLELFQQLETVKAMEEYLHNFAILEKSSQWQTLDGAEAYASDVNRTVKRLMTQFNILLIEKKMEELAKDNRAAQYKYKERQIAEHRLTKLQEELRESTRREGTKSLIILIQDYEGFDKNMLSDMFAILDEISAIPIAFIIGGSSLSSPTFRRLPLETCQHLDIKMFEFTDATKCTDQLIESILVDQIFPIQVSGRVLSWIYGEYLKSNGSSMEQLLKVLRFILMKHFSSVRHSFLCLWSGQHDDAYPMTEVLEKWQIKQILLSNNLETKGNLSLEDTLKTQLLHVQMRRELMKPLWECFHLFVRMLQNSQRWMKSGNMPSHVKVFINLLTGKFTRADVCNHIQAAEFKNLKYLLQQWIQILQRSLGHGNDAIISSLIDQIDNLAFLATECAEFGESSEMAMHVKNDIFVFFFDEMISKRILQVSHLPLYSNFIYDDLKALEAAFGSYHRPQLFNQLRDPEEYLNNHISLLPTQIDELAGIELDMERIYRIYEDSPIKSNIAEWYEEFTNDVTAVEGPEMGVDELQVRFVRCISTLEALGFLKARGQSTDIVHKLIYM